MYGAKSGEFACGSWGLKGYKTSPTPTPHLAGNTCNSIGAKRRKNICTQRLCAVRQRRSSEFDSFYIHPLPCFIYFFKKISVVKMITAASRIRTCAGEPHWISSPTP